MWRQFVSTGPDVTVSKLQFPVPYVLLSQNYLFCCKSSAAHIMQGASRMTRKNRTCNSSSSSQALGHTKEALVLLSLSNGTILVEVS